jgi:hypothetical protein
MKSEYSKAAENLPLEMVAEGKGLPSVVFTEL